MILRRWLPAQQNRRFPVAALLAASGGAQSVTPDAVASGAQVFAPVVGVGAVTVTPAFVASSAQVFDPTVTTGVAVIPDTIPSAAQVFAPTVTTGAVTVAPAAIASTATVYSPTVARGAVTVTPDAIGSAAAVYAPTAARGAVTVTPAAIASAAAVYAPALLTRSTIGGVLQVDPTNGRYFRNDSGPLVLVGFHTWYEFQDGGLSYPPTAFDYAGWLDYLDARGVNLHKLWVMETARQWADADAYFYPMPYQRTGPGNAADGRPKFDLTLYDAEYFTRLRERAILAGNRGHYVVVQLFQGWQVESKGYGFTPYAYHPYNAGNNVNGIDGDTDNDGAGEETRVTTFTAVYDLQKAYVAKVLDTLNDLDNVIYEISNEDTSNSVAWQHDLIDYIHTYEAGKPKQHPVGMTVIWPSGSDSDLTSSGAEWISPNNGNSLAPGTADGSQVVLFDTDHIVGLTTEYKWIWQSFTRGYNPAFMDVYDGALYGADMRADAAHEKIRYNLGYVIDMAAGLDLANATPQNSLSSTGYCLASATQLVAYQHTSGAFTVNLTSLTGTYSLNWLRPANGDTQAGSNVSGGAVRTLTPPWAGEDAVALLQKLADEIAPAFIASAAQVFAPTVGRGPVTVTPAAIASGAAVYAPTVTVGAVTVTPATIGSAAQVFAPTITQAGQIIPDTIPSAAAVYAPTVAPGAVAVTPDAIPSGATVFAPTVTTGAQIVPDFVPSSAQVFAVTVTVGAVTVAPDAISSAAQVFGPAVLPGAVTVAPDAIASAAQVFDPAVTAGGLTVAPAFIASDAAVFAPAVTVGAVTVTPDFIPSAAQVFAPFAGNGTLQTVAPDFVPSVAQVFTVILLAIPASRVRRVEREERTFVIEYEDRTYTVQGE